MKRATSTHSDYGTLHVIYVIYVYISLDEHDTKISVHHRLPPE